MYYVKKVILYILIWIVQIESLLIYQIKQEKLFIRYQFPDLTFTNLIANKIMSQTCQFTVLKLHFLTLVSSMM